MFPDPKIRKTAPLPAGVPQWLRHLTLIQSSGGFAAPGCPHQVGPSGFIDLREGDLRETLRQIDAPVDFILVDIWIGMARRALELVAPKLRPGAMVVCDNAQLHCNEYADYFEFVADPVNGFRTMALPFESGLELSVRCEPNGAKH